MPVPHPLFSDRDPIAFWGPTDADNPLIAIYVSGAESADTMNAELRTALASKALLREAERATRSAGPS